MKKALLLLMAVLLLLPARGFAHKISAFVDVEGNTVELSSYFSDGTPVKKGEVKVYNSEGRLVFQGKTDENGEIHFKLKKPGKYRAVVIAELGHRTEATFSIGKEEKERKEIPEKGSCVSSQELRQVVREELKPIREELLKIEEENARISFKDVIGGIGWILGIFGGAVLLSRRKNGRESGPQV